MNARSVKNSVATLVQLRDVYRSQLDARALDELESVIADLQKVGDRSHSTAEISELMMRSLQVIAIVVRIVTDMSKWMQ